MRHLPVNPEILSRDQLIAVCKHNDEAFVTIVAATTKLLTILHPDRLPNDLGAEVRKFAEVIRDIVNASHAEHYRIVSVVRDSEPLQ